ncbi:MAG: ABC transporter substrate-binding protein, partial [Phycisphaerales bacterium]
MKILAPFALILAALMTVVYLDDAPPRADVVFVDAAEVFTLDPQRMSWIQDFRMAYAVYEGLVRWDNTDFSIEPAAATWTVSDDQLTYTFNIRTDAKWSNGDPLTAHDFVYAWRRAILPDTAADYTAMFFAIAGAEAFFNWRAQQLREFAEQNAELAPQARAGAAKALWRQTEQRFQQTVGLEAIDDHTLRVRLVRPTAYFLDLVAFGVFYPVHRPAVEGWELNDAITAQMRQHGWKRVDEPDFADREFATLNADTGRFEQKHGWTKPDRFVGNGPYVPTHWRYKRGLRLGRNPHYHSSDRVGSDSIETVSIDDINTAILAFESGRVDWLSDVSAEYQADMLAERATYDRRYADQIESMLANGRTLDEALAALPPPEPGERRNIHVFPTFGTDFYSFNCRATLADGRPNPFADARVRR